MNSHQFQEYPASRETCLNIYTELLGHITTIINPHHLDTAHGTTSHDNAMVIMPKTDLAITNLMALGVLKDYSNKLDDMIGHLQGGKAYRGVDRRAYMTSPPTGREEYAPQQASESEDVEMGDFDASHVGERTFSGINHVFEDISIGNHAKQILVLSPGDSCTVKRVTVGDGGAQLLGAFSDMSVRDCLDKV